MVSTENRGRTQHRGIITTTKDHNQLKDRSPGVDKAIVGFVERLVTLKRTIENIKGLKKKFWKMEKTSFIIRMMVFWFLQ